jgi:uncharacterized protein DUF748
MLKKILITLFVLLALVGLYAAAGFYLLPKLVRDKLPELVTELTGQSVQLQDAQFDPFEFTVNLQGFNLSAKDGKPLLSFTELAIDVAVIESIKQRALILTSAALQKPIIDIERYTDGRFNFSDAVDKVSPPGEETSADSDSSVPPLLIHHIHLIDGQISWLDMQLGQNAKETLSPVNFSIAEFTTKPDAKPTFGLGFKLESGGELDWQGDINLTDLSSKGQIKIDKLKLNKVWLLFLQDSMSQEIVDGLLTLQADYNFSSNDQAGLVIQVNKASVDVVQLQLIDKAKASHLADLSVEQLSVQADVTYSSDDKSGLALRLNKAVVDAKQLMLSDEANSNHMTDLSVGQLLLHTDVSYSSDEKSGPALQVNNGVVDVKQLLFSEEGKAEQLIDIPMLAVQGVNFDLQKQSVNVAALSSSDAKIKAWLQADGQVNYQALFASDTNAADQAPAAAEQAGKPWQIALDELDLTNYQIEFTDNTQKKPVTMQLSELNAKVKEYRNVDGLRLPVQFSTRVNNAGSLKLDGNMVLAPFSVDLALNLEEIQVKTFQPYVDPFLKLDLVDGDVNTQGHLQISLVDELQVGYQGNVNIANLITRDKVKNEDFLKWRNLELKQMVIDLQKQDFKLGKVIFYKPYFKFMIKKDGTNNVSDLIVVQPKSKSTVKPAAKKTKKTPEPIITIGKIEMKNGQSDFADYSLILPFVAKMNDLDGEVDGFISNANATTELRLQGKVYDLAPVNIAGNYHFKTGDSEITLNFSNMPLPLITPYMADFAGYTIEKGQMALDLKYSIKKGQLLAENKIFIDQLVLGEKVENPKAVSMPLELGISLLKDADGKINLNFPISGSLEDPEFSVGSLVADVFVNLITKAATAPFKAIGSLFDSDADMSEITFAAGSSDLSTEERAKLDQIAKALATKPELVLEVKGIAYEIQDWPAMRFDAVIDILKKMKSGEMRDRGDKVRYEYIELSDDEYKRLLEKFYTEVFPQKIDHSFFGNPRIKSNPDGDFYSLAITELEGIMKPDPQRLNDLAVSRANQIAKYLTEKVGVDRGRIYILATQLNSKDTQGVIRALLSLNVAS